MTAEQTGAGPGLEVADSDRPTGGIGGVSRQVPIEEIEVNPDQPKSRFDDESLEEMANSMKVGILQPIVIPGRTTAMS